MFSRQELKLLDGAAKCSSWYKLISLYSVCTLTCPQSKKKLPDSTFQFHGALLWQVHYHFSYVVFQQWSLICFFRHSSWRNYAQLEWSIAPGKMYIISSSLGNKKRLLWTLQFLGCTEKMPDGRYRKRKLIFWVAKIKCSIQTHLDSVFSSFICHPLLSVGNHSDVLCWNGCL